jgi:spore maturation protein CgeB
MSNDEQKLYSCDVAFVGNTNKEGIEKFEHDDYLKSDLQDLVNRSVELQIKSPHKQMHNILSEIDNEKILDILKPELKLSFEAYCILKSTMFYRKRIVNLLSKNFNFKIFGDIGWKDEFPENYVKPVDYFKDLSKVYRSAKIIVNVTSFQMNSAINQRVFDIPLSQGFLISDYRSDYDDLFGKDIIPTFRNENELLSLVKYYLEHQDIRENKSKEIKKIILEKHTYETRIREMFSKLKNNYKNV